ncbi:cyclase family protein [Bacteriovoracaceae bacterium]|nr:cyclase family protein [Bacteriovoracaceae bacterium]
MNYIDITPTISKKTAVFPGDVPFSRKVSLNHEPGTPICLSSITTTLHLGAHTDAPSHYDPSGEPIHSRSLQPYMGKCQVVDLSKLSLKNTRISFSHWNNRSVTSPRILFKTHTFPDHNSWNDDFASFDPKLIEYFASKKVELIGIDTPSIDPPGDKILPAHKMVYAHNLSVLEGIILGNVDEGEYKLIALPLPIQDADASPVRAILITGDFK